MNNTRLNSWMMLIAIIVAVGGVVTAHFSGISEAKNYTDVQVSKIERKVDVLLEKQQTTNEDVAVIKNILQTKKWK